MMQSHSEISRAIGALKKERREFQANAMRDFDDNHYDPKMKELRSACGDIGHNWQFSHLGPLSDPWFYCSVCGASKCERESD